MSRDFDYIFCFFPSDHQTSISHPVINVFLLVLSWSDIFFQEGSGELSVDCRQSNFSLKAQGGIMSQLLFKSIFSAVSCCSNCKLSLQLVFVVSSHLCMKQMFTFSLSSHPNNNCVTHFADCILLPTCCESVF